MLRARHQGFSLVELSIVILIMGLLLGGLLLPLSVQRENARLEAAVAQVDDIEAAVFGFALANGHLPCPATPASLGEAASAGGGCASAHGFVPASTLGLPGTRNADNLLLDPWASPVRYSVSASDADGDGQWDFVVAGEMQDVSIPVLSPDLVVCRTAAGSSSTACADPASTLSASAPFVIYSIGKDWATSAGADQQENVGATLGGGPAGVSYAVAGDAVFVSRTSSIQSGNEFDDVLRWASPLTLYRELISGAQLP